ncbi:hypothetical protein D3C75_1233130 [compost metagenome]
MTPTSSPFEAIGVSSGGNSAKAEEGIFMMEIPVSAGRATRYMVLEFSDIRFNVFSAVPNICR